MNRYWCRLLLSPLAGALTGLLAGPPAWIRGAVCFLMLTLAMLPFQSPDAVRWSRTRFFGIALIGGLAAGVAVAAIGHAGFPLAPPVSPTAGIAASLFGCSLYSLGWSFAEVRLKGRETEGAGLVYGTAWLVLFQSVILQIPGGDISLLYPTLGMLPVGLGWRILMWIGGAFPGKRRKEETA